ncbi:MAG: YkgJ family cysteine cluster protein [Candidatus Gastranaerophilales bacterium]|nr:YkgJ family cysteine cluster protein [Candidatus Gastranaerophilales bacterium]
MSEVVKRVQELLKLPQHLCNMCGKCCRIATFKGGLSYKDVLKLANSNTEEPSQIEGAKDFLSIFVPYSSVEEAKKVAPEFVAGVIDRFGEEANTGFFYCKYLNNNMCQIHEDRPLLCRMYPIPHERTLYNPECGFKEQGKKNWEEIENIIKELEAKQNSDNN